MPPETMRRHWFFILLSLAERERHGSGIMRDVLELTGGEVRLWPVTLYGSLEELREHGYIRALESAPPGAEEESEGGRKHWFRITPQGRRALAGEVGRMETVLQVAQRRLAHTAEQT